MNFSNGFYIALFAALIFTACDKKDVGNEKITSSIEAGFNTSWENEEH